MIAWVKYLRGREKLPVRYLSLHNEGEDFYRRVHAAYGAIAAREPGRVALVDGNDGIETVAERVRAVVADRLRNRLAKDAARLSS